MTQFLHHNLPSVPLNQHAALIVNEGEKQVEDAMAGTANVLLIFLKMRKIPFHPFDWYILDHVTDIINLNSLL